MTFLNGLLAFGAAAFTIPLLIHLLHRNRVVTVDWGAMHLLQFSRNVNAKRVQWQQLLLLFLRCLLPILLALAMSRPLFQSWLATTGPAPISIAILIDDSMSMFARDNTGQVNKDLDETNLLAGRTTRFAKACSAAIEILGGLPAGSNAAVLLSGTKPETIDGQVPDELAIQLEQLINRTVPAGELDLENSLRLALDWLAKSQHPRRQMVVVSDYQTNDWSKLSKESTFELVELIKKQDVVPEFAMVNIAPTRDEKQSNLSIDSILSSPSTVASGQECIVNTTIGNHGDQDYSNVPIAVYANDIEIDRQHISLPANTTALVRSRWAPKHLGDQLLRSQILRDDWLAADNTSSSVLVVKEPMQILLVDGDRKKEPMQSETDFLRLALSPFSILHGEKGDMVITKSVQPQELSELLLKAARVVCLCNVAEVPEPQQRWLRDFVNEGNGLIVFLGDRVRIDQYQSWPSVANGGLRIANLAGRNSLKSTDNGPETRLNTQQIEFVPIRDMSPLSLASLAKARFESRVLFSLDPAAMLAPFSASVAVRFEDNQPWLLQTNLGNGRCLWVSTSCDDDDSNLPSRTAFLPLIQKLAAYAAQVEPPDRQLTSGSEWSASISPKTIDSSKSSPGTIQVARPDKKSDIVQMEEGHRFHFNDTRLLGPYIATGLTESDSTTSGLAPTEPMEEMSSAIFALNRTLVCVKSDVMKSSTESQWQPLSSKEMADLAKTWNARFSNSSVELLDSTRSVWHGREIWTWLWTALVICFLAEIALEQRLSPRSHATRQSRGQGVS